MTAVPLAPDDTPDLRASLEHASLHDLVRDTARRLPDALAVSAAGGAMTYAELDRAADRFAAALAARGVRVGDRVGVWLDKSAAAVAAMQGALRLGAAYVPLDPLAPVARIATIMTNCEMAAVVTTPERLASLDGSLAAVPAIVVPDPDSVDGLPPLAAPPTDVPHTGGDDLAYILYTSGSTGTPKGVCISHRNALAFVRWAHDELAPTPADRFANHAPFHFDLSVLDLYVAFMNGASTVLVPDGLQYVPSRLVELLADERITVWYSVPSALMLMIDQGGLLERDDLAVRAWLFAGEPFPLSHLRRLFDRFRGDARFLNLYGPTETNVCTFYEVTDIAADRVAPVPIGHACSGDEVWAVTADGTRAAVGEPGELLVAGPTVALGYWGREPHGDKPYATGDIVRLEPDGEYVYLGRRDHMVKIRGHRIELGDVEAALGAHDGLREVAVIVAGSSVDAKLVAYAVAAGERKPSLLELKRWCAERLPRYMIIDTARFVPELPRTRNGKVDRTELTTREEGMTAP